MEDYAPIVKLGGNERFTTYSGVANGRKVFIKQAVDPALKERILYEAAGLMNMREIDSGERFYRVPEVVAVADGYIVTTWAEGTPMENAFVHDDVEAAVRYLGYMAGLYAFLDGRSTGQIGLTRYGSAGREGGIEKFARKLEDADYEAHIDGELVRSTLNYAQSVLATTDTRFTNGDLTPGNILVDGDDFWLIDCETTSWLWPRHYNAVNLIFNYGRRFPALTNELVHTLDSYCSAVGITAEAQDDRDALNVTAALRCFGTIIEQIDATRENGGSFPDDTKEYVETAMRNISNGLLFNSR